MKKYKVGDTAYVSEFGQRAVQVKCPVCFGKCCVHLTLGNDDVVEMPCEYCNSGHEPPKGYVTQYRRDAGVKCITIHAVNITESFEGEKIDYRSDHYGFQPEHLFDTEKYALKDSQRRADEYNLEMETKAENVKGKPDKNYSWNAGYHMRLVKDAQGKIEYHSKMAKICKERAR